MSIRSGQMMKKSNDWIFFLNKQELFLSLVFNELRCRGNSTRLSQNARIHPSVVNLV